MVNGSVAETLNFREQRSTSEPGAVATGLMLNLRYPQTLGRDVESESTILS